MPQPYRSATLPSTGGTGSTPWNAGYGQAPFEVGIGLTGATTTILVSVQYTFDNIFDSFGTSVAVVASTTATWYTITGFSSVTAAAGGVFNIPCIAIRAFATSSSTTGATAGLTLIQSGP